jgi:hypothetical protein
MEFDQYEGAMSLFTVMLEHDLLQHVSIGLGYSYYRLRLESESAELNGILTTEHHGPFVFAGLGF